MSRSRDSPLTRMVSSCSRCWAGRSASSSRLVMPMTPFIGVRISWLMLARNSLRTLSARSATSLAVTSSSSASLSAVTSWVMPTR